METCTEYDEQVPEPLEEVISEEAPPDESPPEETLPEEKLIAQLKGVKLSDSGKGTLSLTENKLEFECRKGFFSSPQLELSIDLLSISSAEIDQQSNMLTIDWQKEIDEYVATQLRLPKGDNSTNLYNSLNGILEQIKLEAQQQEQWGFYQEFLWRTAYSIWTLSKILMQIVQDLSQENWDLVDASISEAKEIADNLTLECAMDVAGPVHSVVEVIPFRDASLAFEKAVNALQAIGISFKDDSIPVREWGEIATENFPGLQWQDIGYIYLFVTRYHLMSLLQQMGQIESIDDSLTLLTKLSSIIEYKTSPEQKTEATPLEEEPEDQQLESIPPEEESTYATKTPIDIDAFAQEIEILLKMNAGKA